MTPAKFRSIALTMEGVSENAHMGHPDFRVGGKVFATLGYPDKGCGSLMLTPAEQEKLLKAHPGAFTPAAGAWGRRGSTIVRLDAVDVSTLRLAIASARQTRAPKR
jgi:hypothetical protein